MRRIQPTTGTRSDRTMALSWSPRSVLTLVALVSLFLAVAAPRSTAQQTSWQHGNGIYTVTDTAGSVERSVEAWVAPDGRYSVVTTSLNSSRASEEVVFDGVNQFAYITDDAGILKVMQGDTSAHFAVTPPSPSRDGALPRSVHDVLDGGVETNLDMSWSDIRGDEQLLAPTYVGTPIVIERETPGGDNPMPLATGSRSKTFSNCVYAYNFVNTSTNYFRGTSSYRGSCWYMDESLWANSGVSGGSCVYGTWLGSGPTAAQFSSKYVYSSMSNKCTNHAGWLSNWSLIVPWSGLDAAY
jgi:hypothetical protein